MISSKKPRKVVIHDIYNHMTIALPSMRSASIWLYENKYSKSKESALKGITNSLKDQRVIYKRFYLTQDEN